MSEKRRAPVTIPADLVEALWREIKDARDEAACLANSAKADEARLNEMLRAMKASGMDGWIPTLEEVQAVFAE